MRWPTRLPDGASKGLRAADRIQLLPDFPGTFLPADDGYSQTAVDLGGIITGKVNPSERRFAQRRLRVGTGPVTWQGMGPFLNDDLLDERLHLREDL